MKLKSLFCIGMAAISMCSCNNGGGQKMTTPCTYVSIGYYRPIYQCLVCF